MGRMGKVLVGAGMLFLCPGLVSAAFVPVLEVDGDWVGYRTTPVANPVETGQINASDGWKFDDLATGFDGFSIAWEITQDGGTGVFTYKYWLAGQVLTVGADGLPATTRSLDNLSHWTLGLSESPVTAEFPDGMTQAEAITYWSTLIPDGEVADWSKDHASTFGTQPADLFGVKFETGNFHHIEFTTKQIPIWGSFHAIDGNGPIEPGGSEKEVPFATNAGFSDSSGPYPGDGPLNKDLWIPTPDTVDEPGGGGGPLIPEPTSLMLLGLGMLCFVGVRRSRRR